MRIPSLGALLCGLVISSAPALAQHTPEVTFKVEVSSVEEDVRVVDRNGNFVRGLTASDFQIVENGKPQKIANFGVVDLPVAVAPETGDQPVESDVVSNLSGQSG